MDNECYSFKQWENKVRDCFYRQDETPRVIEEILLITYSRFAPSILNAEVNLAINTFINSEIVRTPKFLRIIKILVMNLAHKPHVSHQKTAQMIISMAKQLRLFKIIDAIKTMLIFLWNNIIEKSDHGYVKSLVNLSDKWRNDPDISAVFNALGVEPEDNLLFKRYISLRIFHLHKKNMFHIIKTYPRSKMCLEDIKATFLLLDNDFHVNAAEDFESTYHILIHHIKTWLMGPNSSESNMELVMFFCNAYKTFMHIDPSGCIWSSLADFLRPILQKSPFTQRNLAHFILEGTSSDSTSLLTEEPWKRSKHQWEPDFLPPVKKFQPTNNTAHDQEHILDVSRPTPKKLIDHILQCVKMKMFLNDEIQRRLGEILMNEAMTKNNQFKFKLSNLQYIDEIVDANALADMHIMEEDLKMSINFTQQLRTLYVLNHRNRSVSNAIIPPLAEHQLYCSFLVISHMYWPNIDDEYLSFNLPPAIESNIHLAKDLYKKNNPYCRLEILNQGVMTLELVLDNGTVKCYDNLPLLISAVIVLFHNIASLSLAEIESALRRPVPVHYEYRKPLPFELAAVEEALQFWCDQNILMKASSSLNMPVYSVY